MIEVARDFRKEPTPSEKRLWQALRGQSLQGATFRRQQPIGPFVVDFYCAQHALIVEVDGPIHAAQMERDGERQALPEACGYRVLRVTAFDVESDLGTVMERIRQAITPHSPTPFPAQVEGKAGEISPPSRTVASPPRGGFAHAEGVEVQAIPSSATDRNRRVGEVEQQTPSVSLAKIIEHSRGTGNSPRPLRERGRR